MTLQKAMIAESISENSGVTYTEAERYVEFVLEKIKSTLADGEDVLISGFGKFSVRSKEARKGRNPANGEEMTLDGRRVVNFKCSPRLKDRLNGNDDGSLTLRS